MEPARFLEIMHTAEALKNNTRHSWTSAGRHESVAEHSWRLCMMAYFVRDEFPGLDGDKLLQMCLFHDMGEAFTGDVPSFEKTEADEQAEQAALAAWVDSLPAPYAESLRALYAEMDALQTPEAKVYKAMDNLEAVMQHNEADLSTWLPLEYQLQLTYGEKTAAAAPWLLALKAQLNADTLAKISAAAPAPAPEAPESPDAPELTGRAENAENAENAESAEGCAFCEGPEPQTKT